MINNTFTKMIHEQEPKDAGGVFVSTGTDQKHRAAGFIYEILDGINTINIDWGRTGPKGIETSIWDTRLEVWRVL
jgi:hypothetical protein